MTKIYPVIHHFDTGTTINEASKILNTGGVYGVFLISHQGITAADMELLSLANAIKAEYPQQDIGVNLLTIDACAFVLSGAIKSQLDMVWFDALQGDIPQLKSRSEAHNISIFAPVAFKHQPQEADPVGAAMHLRKLGFIPTTSGLRTGEPPTVEKIRCLSMNGSQPLAVASGMTPENVAAYTPYLSHILVASGIAMDDDFYRVDLPRLEAFIQAVKG